LLLPLIQRKRIQWSKNIIWFCFWRKKCRYNSTWNIKSMIWIRWKFVPFQKSHFKFKTNQNWLFDFYHLFWLIWWFTIFTGYIWNMIWKMKIKWCIHLNGILYQVWFQFDNHQVLLFWEYVEKYENTKGLVRNKVEWLDYLFFLRSVLSQL